MQKKTRHFSKIFLHREHNVVEKILKNKSFTSLARKT